MEGKNSLAIVHIECGCPLLYPVGKRRMETILLSFTFCIERNFKSITHDHRRKETPKTDCLCFFRFLVYLRR